VVVLVVEMVYNLVMDIRTGYLQIMDQIHSLFLKEQQMQSTSLLLVVVADLIEVMDVLVVEEEVF
jgi:hypothetical protein